MSEKTVIEINGIKMEIDLRNATRIDTLRVGDRVKVLVKNYSDYSVYAGVIIGFECFKNLPTIIVAYMHATYSTAELKFLHFNAATKETEIIKAIDDDQLDFNKSDMVATFDRDITKKKAEIQDILDRKEYFLKNFRAYWEPVGKPELAGE